MSRNGWAWAAKDGAQGKLLYEPGNWGDILKALWLVRVLCAFADAEPLRYADPFAGRPAYPLAEPTRQRIERIEDPSLDILQPFLAKDAWPGSAALAAAVRPASDCMEMLVFDADPARRAALAEDGRFRMPEGASCGWALAKEWSRRASGAALALVDPYDFLGEWRERLPMLLEVASRASVLLYVYNRAARGPERMRDYRDFRNALDDARPPRSRLIGRVPADGFLPRAHHEMLFLPAGPLAEEARRSALFDALEDATLRLDRTIRRSGVVER